MPLISSRINDGNWSKISSHVKATSVSCGSVAAAGESILSVCFREITPGCYYQFRGLRIFPLNPGYYPKADTENPKFRGDLRPLSDTADEYGQAVICGSNPLALGDCFGVTRLAMTGFCCGVSPGSNFSLRPRNCCRSRKTASPARVAVLAWRSMR